MAEFSALTHAGFVGLSTKEFDIDFKQSRADHFEMEEAVVGLVPWFVVLVAGMARRAQIPATTMLNHSLVHVVGGLHGLQHLLNRNFFHSTVKQNCFSSIVHRLHPLHALT